MSLDERITQVRDLLRQRDHIDEQLAGLLGGGTAILAAEPAKDDTTPRRRSKPAPAKEPKKSGRKCGLCGEPGHRRERCPNGEQQTGDRKSVSPDILDELQFTLVREKFKSLGTSKAVADEYPELDAGEINRALMAKDYKEYKRGISR